MSGLVPGDPSRVAHLQDLAQGTQVGEKIDEIAPHHSGCRKQALNDAVVTGDEITALKQTIDQQQAVEPEQRRQQGAVGQDGREAPGVGCDHRHQPHGQQHQEQQVNQKAQQVGKQPAAIAPEEVVECPDAAPAQVAGALKDDPYDPARLLADRVSPVTREVFAHADNLGKFTAHAPVPFALERQLRVAYRIAGKDALHAFVLEPEADVVVFGQALYIECDTVAVFK